jgi:hypothetical protein
MRGTPLLTSMMPLVVALGCGGRENGTSTHTDASGGASTPDSSDAMSTGMGNDAGHSGSSDATTTSTTSGDAGDSGSWDAIATMFCDPTSVDAGTVSEGDAGVPLHHRATAACCPSQRGPGPPNQPYPLGIASPLAPDAGGCTSDSQCKGGVNGRCFPFEGLVGSGGCSYDECFTDSTCGSRTPCLCRNSSTDNSTNSCDPGGNCAIDSDCGPGGYCSPSWESCQGPTYYCHTALDTCINDADCPSIDAGAFSCPNLARCAYDPQAKHWACTHLVCCPP